MNAEPAEDRLPARDWPTISVIIPSHNCARFLERALDSVLSQSVPVTDVIVVDNGSTDNTREVVAAYDANVVHYIYQSNKGVSAARNRGIHESRSELIAFLDADDVWLPGKLAKQLACLASSPGADLVHTDILYLDDLSGALEHRELGRARFVGRCAREFFWHCRVHTSSVLVTRRALDEVGPFDEHIVGGCAEDLDLFLRIAHRFSLAYVPEPLVHYRIHGNNATLNGRRMAESNLHVYRRALEHAPEMWQVLGRRKVREYLQHLAFIAGYMSAESDDLRRARAYFSCALRYGVMAPYIWMLWAATFLPPSMRQWLRSLKQNVAT